MHNIHTACLFRLNSKTMLGYAFVSPFSLTVHLVLNTYCLKKEKEKYYKKEYSRRVSRKMWLIFSK